MAAVRGRDADCFGSPPPTPRRCCAALEAVRALRARVEGVSVAGAAAPAPTSVRRSRPGRGRRAGPAGRPRPRWRPHSDIAPRRTISGRLTSRSHRRLRRLHSAEHPICEGGRVVKKSERDNRRAIAEQMRKEQARKERRRSLLILGACVVVVLGLLGTAVFVYVAGPAGGEEGKRHSARRARGERRRAAACDPVKKVEGHRLGQTTSTRRRRSPTRTRRRRSAPTGATSCRAPRSAASTPSRTGPRSSVWCTASSTATRSSGTTTR